jgi:hypothetical protein
VPDEQNTQQSPGAGRSRSPHTVQGVENWQASTGHLLSRVVSAERAGDDRLKLDAGIL